MTELKKLVADEQNFLIYIKNVFLQNLNLPYDEEIIKSAEKEAEEDVKNIKPEIIDLAKKLEKDSLEYYSKKEEERKRALNFVKENFNDLYVKAKENHNKRIEKNKPKQKKTLETYDHTDINSLISNLSLDFDMINFLFAGIDTSHYNIPYGFKSKDVYSILALDFKEFKTTKYNIIRKCQNGLLVQKNNQRIKGSVIKLSPQFRNFYLAFFSFQRFSHFSLYATGQSQLLKGT